MAIIPIPFVFYKYGYKIRRKSALIMRMQMDQMRLEGKRKRLVQRTEGNAATEQVKVEV